jgi:hypothetical protein
VSAYNTSSLHLAQHLVTTPFYARIPLRPGPGLNCERQKKAETYYSRANRREERAVQTIRAWIEGFLRGRYGLEGLGRVLAVPVLIGAILVVGWLLVGPLLTIPRFTTEGPVVRNGVTAVMVCGKKAGTAGHGLRGFKGMSAAMKYVPEPATGAWWPVHRGDCTVWYHRPPLPEQRFNRHERAQQEGYAP